MKIIGSYSDLACERQEQFRVYDTHIERPYHRENFVIVQFRRPILYTTHRKWLYLRKTNWDSFVQKRYFFRKWASLGNYF